MKTSTHFANANRIKQARLKANMSRADLAFAIRQHTGGQIKATERGVAGWERREYAPSDGVVPAIAAVTNESIEFFYGADESDDEEEAELLRDLEQMDVDLRARIERALERRAARARSTG